MAEPIVVSQAPVSLEGQAAQEIADGLLRYIHLISTVTGRGTFYNDASDEAQVEREAHASVLNLDRGVYGAIATLPGVMDRAKMATIIGLLSNPRPTGIPSKVLPGAKDEEILIHALTIQLPIARRMRLFVELADRRVNNARTRQLIARTLFWETSDAERLAISYRRKFRRALVHILREGNARKLREEGVAPAWFTRAIGRNVPPSQREREVNRRLAVARFVLGREKIEGQEPEEGSRFSVDVQDRTLLQEMNVRLPKIKAYLDAKEDPSKLGDLPRETALGIRSTYHPGHETKKVVEATKDSLGSKEAMRSQASSARHGVKVEWDPSKNDLVDLMAFLLNVPDATDETKAKVRAAIARKAEAAARGFQIRPNRIGVVLDTSASMAGSLKQMNRPLAIGMAVWRVLLEIAEASWSSTGPAMGLLMRLTATPKASGSTNLAKPLAEMLSRPGMESVFIISDAYENELPGAALSVLKAARRLGVGCPVWILNPVAAAEVSAVRTLGPGFDVMGISKPEDLAQVMFRQQLLADLDGALASLCSGAIRSGKRLLRIRGRA